MKEMTVALVIPSLHPTHQLVTVVSSVLDPESDLEVIVVDDGSGPEYASVFGKLSALPGCTVLRHGENRGKGAALKTAFRHCAENSSLECVVTADSDGQHSADDIRRIVAATRQASRARDRVGVLGVRDFMLPHVPFKSRFGNRLTTSVLWVLSGRKIQDTQTGLRGFSHSLLPDLVAVQGARFEYEMNVLLWALHQHVEIESVPIDTIYHDQTNSESHFRPIQDSVRIYGHLLRQVLGFAFASLVAAFLDLLVFALVIDGLFGGAAVFAAVSTATLVARILSSLANFTMNRRVVFQHRGDRWAALVRYYVLALTIVVASSGLTTLLGDALSGHIIWAKVLVDGLLFGVSFFVQKRWVFRSVRS